MTHTSSKAIPDEGALMPALTEAGAERLLQAVDDLPDNSREPPICIHGRLFRARCLLCEAETAVGGMTPLERVSEGVALLLRRHIGEAYNEWDSQDHALLLALIAGLSK